MKRVAGDIQIDAIQFKKEANGDYSNIVIDDYSTYTEGATTYQGSAIKIQDASTNTNQVNGSKINLTNVKIINTAVDILGASVATPPTPISVVFPVGKYAPTTTANGASLTTGAWSTVGGINLIQ